MVGLAPRSHAGDSGESGGMEERSGTTKAPAACSVTTVWEPRLEWFPAQFAYRPVRPIAYARYS